MAENTDSAPSLEVTQNVHHLQTTTRYGPGAFADFFGSGSDAEAPIVGGIWQVDDFDNGTDTFTAEYDEMKYIISGESTWKNTFTGELFQANAGSLLWIPKGSLSCMIRSKGLKAVYVEQTYRQFAKNPEYEAWMPKLQKILDRMTNEYVERNPESQKRFECAQHHMPGGNTRSVLHYEPFPLALQSGRSCYVTSIDGDEYLDFVSEFSAALFGHSNPAIQEALHRAIDGGLNLGGPGASEVELAGLITARFPSIEQVRFCNSGTEANTMALAVALKVTGRRKILVFENAYHGGFLSFGATPYAATIPHDFVLGRYNDIEYTKSLLNRDLAAIIVEPMQGASGCTPADPEFLQLLRDSATKLGTILIFDEVVTSRLHYHGLQAHYGIRPDMTTLGKYLGGGPSFGAFGGRSDIMEVLNPMSDNYMAHSGTYNNNVLTMAAGIAAAKLVTPEAIAKANQLGDKLRNGINSIMETRGSRVIRATGIGSMVALHYADSAMGRPRKGLYFYLLSKNIIIGNRGFFAISFEHKETHIDQVLQVITAFVDELFSTS